MHFEVIFFRWFPFYLYKKGVSGVNAQIRVWGGGVDCFFILGVLVGNRPRKRFRYFFIPRDFGRLPPYFGRGFGRGFGRKNASDIFASLGIPGAIAWHVGSKVMNLLVFFDFEAKKVFPGPDSMGFVWGRVGRALVRFMQFSAIFAMWALLATSLTLWYPL